jgi:hypothetical protein
MCEIYEIRRIIILSQKFPEPRFCSIFFVGFSRFGHAFYVVAMNGTKFCKGSSRNVIFHNTIKVNFVVKCTAAWVELAK